MSSRKAEFAERFLSYQMSYNKHISKINQGFNDGIDVYTIRGWIGECRHFADKALEFTLKCMEHGGKPRAVNSETGEVTIPECTEDDVRNVHQQRMANLADLETKNEAR